jgi:hypothetical protein
MKGHVDVAELFIENGLEVNGIDAKGCTPLDYAYRYGHMSAADLLKKKGGRANKFRKSASVEKVFNGDMREGEAIVIKLQNGSWCVRTRTRFLIFAYSEIGNPPPEPSLVNGYLTGHDMEDVPWIYFDLNYHPQQADFSLQGRTPIYAVQDRVKHLSFVLNNVLENNYSRLNLKHPYFPTPEKPLDIDGLKVTVIPSYQDKKGYFIECDGLSLFWLSGLSDNYIGMQKDTRAVAFVHERFFHIDLMFIGTPDGIGPEKGNGIREAYLESRGLNPDAVFFMAKAPLERRILYQIVRRMQDPKNIHCSENPGDVFRYSQEKIKR